MSLQIYKDLEQGSESWLEARCGLLTASQIGKLITPTLKVADNDTSRGLALTIAAERITGHVEYIYPTFDMARGTEEEPLARAVYDENIAPVVELGFMTREIAPGVTVGFSPDGLVADDGLVEFKSRKPKEHIKTVLAGKPPAENLAQLYTGLLVSQRSWIDYGSFCAGLEFWTHRIRPDADWFAVITEAAVAFEKTVADIITRYTTATAGLPATERRPDIKDLVF